MWLLFMYHRWYDRYAWSLTTIDKYHLELQPGCKYPYTIGNLYCDPESNTIDCSYDGGDCCLGLVNVDCVGECECHSNALDDEDAGNIMKKITHKTLFSYHFWVRMLLWSLCGRWIL